MIDVVFLLLIFMLLAKFPIAEGLLPMEMAGAGAVPAADPGHTLWVHVQRDAEDRLLYRLDGQPPVASADALLTKIRQRTLIEDPERFTVVVGVESGVRFERMVEVWEGCREIGVGQLATPGG
jgi:biopolymer transport protein ExbD